MTAQTQEVATSLWMGDRDMVSLHLAREVDGGRTTGDQIRKVFGSYFDVVGDVSEVTTYSGAEEWAQALRAEGRFPEPKVPSWQERGHKVLTRLYQPHFLGLMALAANHINDTSPLLSELVILSRRLWGPASTVNDVSQLDIIARACVDRNKLTEERARIMSWFSGAAISDYFDARSQEDGFVDAMREAADARSALLPPPIVPADLRPWEVA
jgi:hypothetical protein